jgi:hypothetical protein
VDHTQFQKAKHTTQSQVLSYATETFKKNIFQGGHSPGKDFLIERNAKLYADRPLFDNFIRHQLIPHMTALRTHPVNDYLHLSV